MTTKTLTIVLVNGISLQKRQKMLLIFTFLGPQKLLLKLPANFITVKVGFGVRFGVRPNLRFGFGYGFGSVFLGSVVH